MTDRKRLRELPDRVILYEIHEKLGRLEGVWALAPWIFGGTVTAAAGWLSWLTVLVLAGCSVVHVAPPADPAHRWRSRGFCVEAEAVSEAWEPGPCPPGALATCEDQGATGHAYDVRSAAFWCPAPDSGAIVLD